MFSFLLGLAGIGLAGGVALAAGREEEEENDTSPNTAAEVPSGIEVAARERIIETPSDVAAETSAGTSDTADTADTADTSDTSGAFDTVDASDTVDTPDTPDPADISIPSGVSGQNDVARETATQDPGEVGRAALSLDNDGPLQAIAVAGRVTTLQFDGEAPASVEILSELDYGNVTVNPDNTLALVLSDTTEEDDLSFDIRVTHQDGSAEVRSVMLDVQPGQQGAGWGMGKFYMLETDANGDVIVEAGENHQKIYVSGSEDALSLADIELIEGVTFEKRSDWVNFQADNPEYGASPEMALAEDAADVLWAGVMHKKLGPQSNWLLFERGYTYDTITAIRGSGESELHPVYIGAWGEGDRPVLDVKTNTIAKEENIVIQGLEFSDGVRVFNKDNVIFDDIVSTGKKLNIKNIDGLTLRNSSVYDVYRETPKKVTDDGQWAANPNRESGIYMTQSDGVLFDTVFFDHNGWAEGYDPGLSADDPHPPSIYSHNIYLSDSNLDVTLRDSIIMRGSANGAQFRSGGVIEDTLFLDNNGSLMFGAGGKDQAGNYSLLNGGVVTSGGYKLTDKAQGALSVGVTNQGYLATVTDTVIAHMADPNNPDEIAFKEKGQHALNHKVADPVYDSALIYNWEGSVSSRSTAADRNVDGLDTDILDQTTIQNFAAQLLGREDATIADFGDYLRAQADGVYDDVVDADLVIDFFRTGFGLETDLRADAETLRFIPNELADGMRWDNRMNWSTDDLPGVQDGDRVELGGNWVTYAGTTRIEDLDFGPGGKLAVNQGYLAVDDHITTDEKGATLSVDNAGQFWSSGYTDTDLLTIDAAGGRFANTGLHTGTTEMNVSDNAEVILASDGADYVMGGGSSLTITGGDAKVGFDGENGDTAVLLMSDDAELSFVAQDGALGHIGEFFSGHFDRYGPGVDSGINLGGADLRIDVSALAGQTGAHELMRADEIIGAFGDITIDGLDLGAQNAVLTVDYTADAVTLELGAAGVGTGAVALEVFGKANDAKGNRDLFEALTNGHGIYPDDDPSSIPPEADDDPYVL